MNEVAIFEDGSSGRSLDVDWKVGQHTPFGVWKCTGDEVESRKCDEGVSETA
jgi:hypothetical protein